MTTGALAEGDRRDAGESPGRVFLTSAWIVLGLTLAGLVAAAVFNPPPPPTHSAVAALAPPLEGAPVPAVRRPDSVILQRQGAVIPAPPERLRSAASNATDPAKSLAPSERPPASAVPDPGLSIRRLVKASQPARPAVFPDSVTLAAHALPAPPTDIPWSREERSRIAVIVTGLGLSEGTTRAALALPSDVALSFSPYAPALDRWAALARAAGHPVFLDLPLQAGSNDRWRAGPLALSPADAWADNEARLDTLVQDLPSLRGVVAAAPQDFLDYHDPTKALLAFLARRGLILVDPRREAGRDLAQTALRDGARGVPADVDLAQPAGLAVRNARLGALVSIAEEHGRALLLTRADPAGIELIAAWIGTLSEKDVLLVPPDQLSSRGYPPTETASR